MRVGIFDIDEIRPDIYRINECGVFCYLVVGKERALLIDTGTGLGDLAGAVRTITDRPVTVAATHGHPDHIGGRGGFPAMYLSPKEKYRRIYGSVFARKRLFNEESAKPYGLKKSDIKRGKYRTKILPLSEQAVFDLGGKTVSVLFTPGHTAGSAVFLSREDKLMFTGDNVCRALWMFLPGAVSVEEWLTGAKKILTLTEEYTPYCAHEVGLQDPAHIRMLVEAGERLVAETKKNTKKRARLVYPPDYTEVGIIYRPRRVRAKRKKK